jgi:hypothetical protein
MESSQTLETVYQTGSVLCLRVNPLLTAWISTSKPFLVLALGVSENENGFVEAKQKGIHLKDRELEDLRNITESGQLVKSFESGHPQTLYLWDGHNITELIVSVHHMYGRRITIRQGYKSVYMGYRHFLALYKKLQELVYGSIVN